MKLAEIRELVHVARGDAPYGVRALARCYSIGDLRRLALRRLPAAAAGYLEGGGEDEWTLRRNREAFGEVELVPRVLRGVSEPDTGTTVLGTRMPIPIALSPVGSPRMFHHDGELAVARAARHAGLPYGVSTLATQPLEAIAGADGMHPIRGHEEIGGFWRAAIARASAAGARRTIRLHESHSSGDLGYALCTVTVQIPPASGAPGTPGADITVWDATIWQRDPGGPWRIAVDISTPIPASVP